MALSLFWEANIYAASQEICCISWNYKVHTDVHKSLPLAFI